MNNAQLSDDVRLVLPLRPNRNLNLAEPGVTNVIVYLTEGWPNQLSHLGSLFFILSMGSFPICEMKKKKLEDFPFDAPD